MRIGNHLGASFEIWSGRQAWFWFVADTSFNEAAIGATANEAEAIREAHSSIEKMVAQRPGSALKGPAGSGPPNVEYYGK